MLACIKDSPAMVDALPVHLVRRSSESLLRQLDTSAARNRGHLIYPRGGVVELSLPGNRYVAPPQFAIWCPPDADTGLVKSYGTAIYSLYVSRDRSAALPSKICTLRLSPLVLAILDHICGSQSKRKISPTDSRLLQVLVDQLALCSHAGSFLPLSDDVLLAPVLRMLDANPSDDRSISELAQLFGGNERTLLRRCHRYLGMCLSEWRQRLRIVKALPLLQVGKKIELIAVSVGYTNASAFITMFRRHMGVTPDDFRRGISMTLRSNERLVDRET